MPVDETEEMQRRQVVVTILNADVQSKWADLHRLAICRRFGIGKRQSWDSIWITMWSRYFGYAERLSVDKLRVVFDARRDTILSDPCRPMFQADWACPLGLKVDSAIVSQTYSAELEELCVSYNMWKAAILGC